MDAGGTDTVVAVNDVADFTLTNTSLGAHGARRADAGEHRGGEPDGWGSDEQLHGAGWSGTGTLDGLLGGRRHDSGGQ